MNRACISFFFTPSRNQSEVKNREFTRKVLMWSTNFGNLFRSTRGFRITSWEPEVLHDDERHLLVIVVEGGHQAGTELVVQPQGLGLEAHPLPRQGPALPGHAQVGKRLLDDDRPAGSAARGDEEHEVQVPVPHFLHHQPRGRTPSFSIATGRDDR